MNKTPPFWFQKQGITAFSLSPFSFIYGKIAGYLMSRPPDVHSQYPVVCVGNLIVGGSGKTPTVIALSKIARKLGYQPGFLSRGYGGRISATTLVLSQIHTARDVGDEPLILARYGPTVIGVNRRHSLELLQQQSVDLVIMDDGFQDSSLQKDFSLIVVDARRGVGNGYCIPSGPIRADMKKQLSMATAILRVGQGSGADLVVQMAKRMEKPVISAIIKPDDFKQYSGIKVLAYSGIADPVKFYQSLEASGADIQERYSFNDHHSFSSEECSDLIARSQKNQLILVTTEKDAIRLSGIGPLQEKLLKESNVLSVSLHFQNPKQVKSMLQYVINFENS
ncbi:tetraacyldisaccharide 4'-kinase [Candidatus Endowatersipora endosymbiont of Watersipora subatra]|uniref:tetraacyldisaccharide 4'-kinase n=1 Tax=Candidatus Endowatersipora endosymbiont of Watersipora subatra TaxID=3077946 RepID=UPI00312C78A1